MHSFAIVSEGVCTVSVVDSVVDIVVKPDYAGPI
jgi:hypothetical protein